MEGILNSPTVQDARKAAKEAQKIGSEFRSDFDRAVDRSKDVAKDLGHKVRGAAEDAASSGRDIAQDYLKRGKRRLSHASERVSAYADDNTAVVAVGAFAAGLLVGPFREETLAGLSRGSRDPPPVRESELFRPREVSVRMDSASSECGTVRSPRFLRR